MNGWAPLALLLGSGLLAVAALALAPRWQAWRDARRRGQPFPAAWRRVLRRRVPLIARLPPPLRRRLEGHVQVFLADKAFIGCQGQPITDELRLTIAAQACLLLLGQPGGPVYPALRQVLVYPSAFVVDRVRPAPGGVQQDQRLALAGESWQQGQVILSWADVREGADDPDDGRNVVLHEFAHQIDQDSGRADGRPWRPTPAGRARWDAVLGELFARLQWQPSPLLGSYAATEPAELLAVATELFFEQPEALAEAEPALYDELRALYGVHPRVW
ncbi:MAG: zinc-dependent peptidase [Burkholderiaceae bacterium]|nr:zinc-dependent peptidase [Burkholderiaceae bacterium]